MMKAFLVYPPAVPKAKVELSMGCLGLEAYLRSKGIAVDGYQGRMFETAGFLAQVKRSRPDVLGMSCDSSNMHLCFSLARKVKKVSRNIYIVLGGAQATFLHQLILERVEGIDAVVRGEGEKTLAELIGLMEKNKRRVDPVKVKGLSYRRDGGIVVNEDRPLIRDLDLLPFPEKTMVDRYASCATETDRDGRLFFMETGRGCLRACRFCNDVGLWGMPRQKSVGRIMKELLFFKKVGGVRRVLFRESTFTANRLRVEALCRSLIKNKLPVEWEAETRVDCVDEKLLTLMKKAGCSGIGYGVESLSDTMLTLMGKGYSAALAMKVLTLTKRLGIRQNYNILLGFPGETQSTLAETFSRIKQLGIYGHPRGLGFFELHPGSSLYARMKQQGLISDEMLFNGSGGGDGFIKAHYSADFQKALWRCGDEIRRLRHWETFLKGRST